MLAALSLLLFLFFSFSRPGPVSTNDNSRNHAGLIISSQIMFSICAVPPTSFLHFLSFQQLVGQPNGRADQAKAVSTSPMNHDWRRRQEVFLVASNWISGDILSLVLLSSFSCSCCCCCYCCKSQLRYTFESGAGNKWSVAVKTNKRSQEVIEPS